MKYSGHLHKMLVQLDDPVQYRLRLNGTLVDLHEAVGKQITLQWSGNIHCIHCGRKTSRSFNQGYCYPCFSSLAQCDICIVSPEKCHYDQGSCREPQWAEEHCMQDHFVYLSNTSGVKVGITRHTQIPARWIDQGAVQALAILKVPKRYHAGLVEVAFKQFLNDKTNWRNMLKHQYSEQNLYQVFELFWPRVKQILDTDLLSQIEVVADSSKVVDITYPALGFAHKINSYNLDKAPLINDILMAIKGQYLIFKNGVINIRKFAGYEISLEIL